MISIKNEVYGGERPLYGLRDARLENVTIQVGESSIKESGNIAAEGCTFEGKYTLWECHGFEVSNSLFRDSARSSLWYSSNCEMRDTVVEAPKMFRRMKGIRLENCQFTNAQETLWDCDDVKIQNCRVEQADYFGMHTCNLHIENYQHNGNYAFQYSKHVEIRNSVLNSKDALWECEDVTLIDCEINGEYLAWYGKNVRLIRCHITGEQPLCYVENLYMEDCTFGEDAVLAFEYCSVNATMKGFVPSIKNPTTGKIVVEQVGDIIIDEMQKAPADCIIEVKKEEK